MMQAVSGFNDVELSIISILISGASRKVCSTSI